MRLRCPNLLKFREHRTQIKVNRVVASNFILLEVYNQKDYIGFFNAYGIFLLEFLIK